VYGDEVVHTGLELRCIHSGGKASPNAHSLDAGGRSEAAACCSHAGNMLEVLAVQREELVQEAIDAVAVRWSLPARTVGYVCGSSPKIDGVTLDRYARACVEYRRPLRLPRRDADASDEGGVGSNAAAAMSLYKGVPT